MPLTVNDRMTACVTVAARTSVLRKGGATHEVVDGLAVQSAEASGAVGHQTLSLHTHASQHDRPCHFKEHVTYYS